MSEWAEFKEDKKMLILLVEDNDDDAAIVRFMLRRAGLRFDMHRVETEARFREVLARDPDIIISDFALPTFSARIALDIRNNLAPRTPFIVVSGTIGEDIAVEVMRNGASDYLIKDRMRRLPAAVEQLIEQSRLRDAVEETSDALRESENFSEAVLSSLNSPIAVLDATGKVIAVNDVWRQQGSTPNSFPWHVRVGGNYLKVCRRARAKYARAGRRAAEIIEEVLAGREAIAGMEYAYASKEGEAWFAMRVTPLRSDQGGVVVAHYDITDRKQAENALIDSQEALRQVVQENQDIMDYSADIICTLDADWHFVRVNPAVQRVLGFTPAELKGRPAHILFPEESAESFKKIRESARAEGVFNFQEPVRRKDGVVAHLSWNVYWSERRNTYFCVVRDVTERIEQDRLLSDQNAILQGIALGVPVRDTLGSVARALESQIPGARASVLLLDSSGRIRHGAAPSLPAEFIDAIDGMEIGPGRGSCGVAAWEKRQVIVEDIAADPLWEDYRELALPHGLRACWSTPILARDDSVMGVLGVYYPEPRRPEARDLRLAEAATRIAALAIGAARTSEQLDESQQVYRSLFVRNPDTVCAFDADGIFTSLNRAGEDMLGYRLGELREETFDRFIVPEQRREVREKFSEVLDRKSVSFETRIANRDGDGFVIDVTAMPIIVSDRLKGVFAICKDMTAQREAQHNYQLAAAALENSAEGVVITDATLAVVSVNRAVMAISGYREVALMGESVFQLFADNGRAADSAIRTALQAKQAWQGEVRFRRESGEVYPVLVSFSAVRDEHGEILHYVCVFNDISTYKDYERRLEHLAHHDSLTNLPNRVLLGQRFGDALNRAKRAGNHVGVLFLDLDRFKHINDSLGHPMGDRLLQMVAERLKDIVRDTDIVARLGGDEFAIILDAIARPEDCSIVAEKVVGALNAPFDLSGYELYTGASIGMCCFPGDGEEVDVLLQHADTAMYRAKQTAPGTFQFFAREMNDQATERLMIANGLRTALERHELFVEYQPRIELATGRITGLEALVRWQHPEWGVVSPARFIPIAEETGMIEAIGEWVMRDACRQVRVWNDAGVPVPFVAINLSARQLANMSLTSRVEAILAEADLPPQCMEFEITEGMLMQDPHRAQALLLELSELGCSIAVDDFGTGYSSLNYLKTFPIDYLKVDRSFVNGVPHEVGDVAITRTIIAMAKSLGMTVIAEGVESSEQLEFLAEAGCDEVQGFYYSRPLGVKAMTKLLQGDRYEVRRAVNA